MTGKLSWEVEQRIQRNRGAKARRFLDHFYSKMREAGVQHPEKSKASLEKALELVRGATKEQWAQVAKHLTEENEQRARQNGSARWKVEDPPSGATFELIVKEIELAIARVAEADRKCVLCGKNPPAKGGDECDTCLWGALLEQRREVEP